MRFFLKIKIIPKTVIPPLKASIGESIKDILKILTVVSFFENIEVHGISISSFSFQDIDFKFFMNITFTTKLLKICGNIISIFRPKSVFDCKKFLRHKFKILFP